MKKKIVGIITAMTMLISAMPQIIVNAAEDITISNLSELEEFRDNVNNGNSYEGKTVTLTADIDMSEKYGEDKENWTPIGNSYDNVFSGTFDGCNYTINNLYINIPEWTGVDGYGLFGYIDGTLKNLNVNGSVIAYSDSVAGIVVSVDEKGAVINCSFDGTVKGITFVGGIAVSANGYISDCHCSGTVDGLHMVGGIVCNVANVLERKGTVENCTNESTVTGGSMVGGIAGALNIYAKVTKCVNKGEVKGVEMTEYEDAEMVGGIAGVNGNSSIENCYNTGLVLGKKQIGGITGSATGPDSDYYTNKLAVKKCYNIGNVTSIGEETAEDIGSIIGENTSDNGDIANNYYLDTCISDAQSTATSLTLEQFADKSNFANWDFDAVWEMSAELGRPVLRSGNANKHIHKICGDENCTDNHEDIEWIAWESADALPTEAGNYYLTADVELNEKWRPADGTNLCMNGHIIEQNSSVQYDHAISTGFKTALTITDCSDTEHKFTEGDNGQWTLDEQNGTKTLNGGVIICPYNTAIINLSANVNLYNINIAGSRTGINNGPYPLNIYGCTFKGNDEAVYAMGYLNMRDCTVSENASGVRTAENGILSVGGEIIISDNVDADGKTRNVYLDSHIKDTYIHITSPLTENSKIGVSAQKRPLTDRPVAVTDANDTDYSKYFTSDDTDSYARYTIENGEDNIVYLKVGTPTDFCIMYDGAGTYLAAAPRAGTYTAILAEYSYSGMLTNLTAVPVTFDEPSIKSIFEDMHLEVPYRIKLMLWDSLNGMIPCCDSDTVIEYSNLG